MQSDSLYRSVLFDLLSENKIDLNDQILVVCGGTFDKETLLDIGFKNVIISNLDERLKEKGQSEFEPYRWDYQDLEKLTYEDMSFDYVVVHSGLHHLRSPHSGILEMYRVAKKGIIGFEPHLSLFTKLGVLFGFGQRYEDAAVFYNDCKFGGVANTEIPNFVYRFREGEIKSIVNTCAPEYVHQFRFWFITRPSERLKGLKSSYRYYLIRTLKGLLIQLSKRCSVFANNIAFYVEKPSSKSVIHPWLKRDNGEITVDKEWLMKKYKDSYE
jgi:SAM-dependent methyltransferase